MKTMMFGLFLALTALSPLTFAQEFTVKYNTSEDALFQRVELPDEIARSIENNSRRFHSYQNTGIQILNFDQIRIIAAGQLASAGEGSQGGLIMAFEPDLFFYEQKFTTPWLNRRGLTEVEVNRPHLDGTAGGPASRNSKKIIGIFQALSGQEVPDDAELFEIAVTINASTKTIRATAKVMYNRATVEGQDLSFTFNSVNDYQNAVGKFIETESERYYQIKPTRFCSERAKGE